MVTTQREANGNLLNEIKFYESDVGRMRTPVFIIPQESLIIAYLQPHVKSLRLSRNGQFNCPTNNTCIILKKKVGYPEGQPAPLLIIKGNNIQDAYTKYYNYLKNQGFYFKKPLYRTFGLNWETFDEFLCTPSKSQIEGVINTFKQYNLSLSSVTIGSGYWQSNNAIGCGQRATGEPTTDTLEVNVARFGGLSGLTEFFNNLINNDIYPMIGMRHRIQQGTNFYSDGTSDNYRRIKEKFQQKGISNPYLSNLLFSDSNTASDPNNRFYFLNTNSSNVISAWSDILHESYGPFKGIKEDDMNPADQKGLTNNQNAENLVDNLTSKVYPVYNSKHNNDFLIFGRNDWF